MTVAVSDAAGLARNNRSGGNLPHNLIEIRDWAVLSAHERFEAFVDLEWAYDAGSVDKC